MAIAPAVTVLVQDINGNTVPGDTRSVTISSSTTAFTPGSVLTVNAVDSVATFAVIESSTEGTHTLTASDGSLTEATSNPFTVRSQTRIPCWTGRDGTVNRSVDRTVTRYFQVGTCQLATLGCPEPDGGHHHGA